jgi:hypothetical protein
VPVRERTAGPGRRGHPDRAGHHEQAATLAVQAEQTARSITDPDRQAEALAEVAGALATAGHHEQAEQAARSIIDPNRQAWALTAVAGALARAGDPQAARCVAAAACVAGSFPVAVRSVLQVDPSVSPVVVELSMFSSLSR